MMIEGGGTFVGRAYLTIVTDVASRCILGVCLTLERLSALSVALCLAQALCPKGAWLAVRNIDHGWPVFERPRLLVIDSAKETDAAVFRRTGLRQGVRIWRPCASRRRRSLCCRCSACAITTRLGPVRRGHDGQ